MGCKWIGAVLIVVGCSGCGFAIAAGLEQVIDYIKNLRFIRKKT